MRRGRTYNSVIAAFQKFAAKLHVSLMRATNGRVGGRMFESPVLVLATTGRRSGKRRETPLLSLEDGGVIVASNGGTASHPAWFLNLTAGRGGGCGISPSRCIHRTAIVRGRRIGRYPSSCCIGDKLKVWKLRPKGTFRWSK